MHITNLKPQTVHNGYKGLDLKIHYNLENDTHVVFCDTYIQGPYELFVALPDMLVNNLSLRHACKGELVNRMKHKNLGEDKSPCKTFHLSLKVGMMVTKRWVQPIPRLPDIAPIKQDALLEAKRHTPMCKAKKFKRKERRHGKNQVYILFGDEYHEPPQ